MHVHGQVLRTLTATQLRHVQPSRVHAPECTQRMYTIKASRVHAPESMQCMQGHRSFDFDFCFDFDFRFDFGRPRLYFRSCNGHRAWPCMDTCSQMQNTCHLSWLHACMVHAMMPMPIPTIQRMHASVMLWDGCAVETIKTVEPVTSFLNSLFSRLLS